MITSVLVDEVLFDEIHADGGQGYQIVGVLAEDFKAMAAFAARPKVVLKVVLVAGAAPNRFPVSVRTLR